MALTLAEVAKTEKDPLRKGIIITIMNDEPIFQKISWMTINGMAYAYDQTVSLPSVGWRKLNAAHSESTGVVNKLTEALKICGFDSDTDKQIVKSYGEQIRRGRLKMKIQAMANTFVQYFLYGNSGARTGSAYESADAPDGLVTRLTATQTVDATGTSATLGSSVFAVRFGDPYVQGLENAPLEAADLGEIDTKPVHRYRLDWATGFAVLHGKAAGRIKNLDTTATLTVAMMDELRGKIVGKRPSVYIMSDRSERQLKANAQTYNVILPTGIDSLGNPVTLWDGIPIIVSDAVIDTEDNTA